MAATGNEAVLLRQLKDYDDNRVTPGLDAKLNAPAAAGSDGQMLVYGESGNQWIDVPEGTAYSADNVTLQLSGTQFSVKDGGINAAKIANGAITANKLASGVIPDVSGFITQTTADGRYATKSHTHEISQVTGLQNALDGKLTQEAANGLYAAKSHTHAAATAGAAGFMSAADKSKLDGLSNYVLPEASSTTLGGVKVASDADFKTFLGIE